jgi:Tol biopolymer transport system component
VSNRNGHFNLFRKHSDGSGAEELLLTDESQILTSDCSRDGKFLFYSRVAKTWDTWALPLEGERKPSLVVPHGLAARLSPDGHWLAYSSIESGNPEVYVIAFGGGQGKWQVSANKGTTPRWSADGKELFYLDPTYNIFAVPVKDSGGALQFGTPDKLVTNWSAPQVFYDVSPDGKKTLLDRVSQQISQSVTVVTNFPMELKKN